MIAFDGNFYQVKADGKAYAVSEETQTPFAAVTFFEDDLKIKPDEGLDFGQLQNLVDSKIPTKNLFYAIRMDGVFSYIKTRSVPAQKKPYPQLVEVTKNQPEFEFKDVKGTIVGFRCPSYVKGINVVGYHLHFLTEDKTGGGHVLEFKLKGGTISLDYTSDFYLVLPKEKGEFFSTDLSKEREKELKEVEK